LVIDSTFEDRIICKPQAKPERYDDWVKDKKIYCKKCQQDWGMKGTYRQVPCCCIKICRFVIIDPYEKRSCSKKWKEVEFPVAALSDEDMADLLKIALERASETRNSEIQ